MHEESQCKRLTAATEAGWRRLNSSVEHPDRPRLWIARDQMLIHRTCRKTNVTQPAVSPNCTRTTKRKTRMATRLRGQRRGGADDTGLLLQGTSAAAAQWCLATGARGQFPDCQQGEPPFMGGI